jgi:hypothetical protein
MHSFLLGDLYSKVNTIQKKAGQFDVRYRNETNFYYENVFLNNKF